LGVADGGGHARHPEVVAEFDVFVAVRLPAVVDEPPRRVGDVRAVGGDHPALARGHVLRRVKREGAHVADGADWRALERRAVGLRRVLDEGYVVGVGDVGEVVHGRGESVEVNRDDGVDVAVEFPDSVLDAVGVEVERLGIDVGEGGDAARHADGVRGGDERERRRDDVTARADADALDGRMERRRPVRRRDGVVDLTRLRECGLEGSDLRPVGEVPGAEYVDHPFDPRVPHLRIGDRCSVGHRSDTVPVAPESAGRRRHDGGFE
jgi:hypothetical protein